MLSSLAWHHIKQNDINNVKCKQNDINNVGVGPIVRRSNSPKSQ
jgi:hypothetical protein